MTLDLSKVSRDIKGESPQETDELRDLLKEASGYLESFPWCGGIRDAYLGIGVGGVVGVFLFRIDPLGHDVDEWVWVIVGDVPPAYITLDDAPNPACALDAYIGAMEKWVAAAKAGAPVGGLIPVNVPASLENAQRLETRLRLLDTEVLSGYREDLEEPTRGVH